MTWSFVVGSLDPDKPTKENSMFLFALDPDAIRNEMMSQYGLNQEGPGRGEVGRAGPGHRRWSSRTSGTS